MFSPLLDHKVQAYDIIGRFSACAFAEKPITRNAFISVE